MGKKRPQCPNCGSQSLDQTRTYAVNSGCHYLECKRFAHYRCAKCGCECILVTPQGELTIVQDGKITKQMALRVLNALNMPEELADKLE